MGVLESPGKVLDFFVSKRVGTLWLGGGTGVLRTGGCVTQNMFRSNTFATLAALLELCTLLSAIVVCVLFTLFACCCEPFFSNYIMH